MPCKIILATVGICVSLISVAQASAKDQLVILSPHRKSTQQEFIPAFKKYYADKFKSEVDVEWLDQGGTSDDVRFLRAKYAATPQTSGIDIFWGGGASVYSELHEKDKVLESYSPPKEILEQIPPKIAGMDTYNAAHTWFGQAFSSFGIFYNRPILKLEGMSEPKRWDDLASYKYFDQISSTDPRRSGSATVMDVIILQSLGWDRGWQLLNAIAANTKKFTHSSSDPIKAVVSGDVATAMSIDYYATAKIAELGVDKVSFILPEGQTVLNADPIAILKGAPNKIVAQRFVDFSLSAEAQKLLILPKGVAGGPQFETLGRLAVNRLAYEQTEGKRVGDLNPMTMKTSMDFNVDATVKMQSVLMDLVGALHVDNHDGLKNAWTTLHKSNAPVAKALAEFHKMPLTEQEFTALFDKWNDNVLRNEMINKWVSFAKAKNEAIINGKMQK